MNEFSIVSEKKFHKLDPAKKPLYIGILLFLLVVVVPAMSYLYYSLAVSRPAPSTQEKIFVINKGEGASSISQRLYEEDLVNSKALFNIYVVLNNLQTKLQAGTYVIPAGSSVEKLAELFQQGRNDVKVTFLEGWRVEEIAREASAKLTSVDYDKFIRQAGQYEGRLFPDTYEFNMEAGEEDVLSALTANFENKTKELLTDEKAAKVGLSKEQVVNLASIVEREVNNEDDAKIVAGILLRRLKEGMLLGADATTQYAIAPKDENWWPENLTIDDLDSNSPYNTRKVIGLPPTPICSPGLSSITAVLEARETDYYYYLTDGEGITHYARTLDEHNANISKFL